MMHGFHLFCLVISQKRKKKKKFWSLLLGKKKLILGDESEEKLTEGGKQIGAVSDLIGEMNQGKIKESLEGGSIQNILGEIFGEATLLKGITCQILNIFGEEVIALLWILRFDALTQQISCRKGLPCCFQEKKKRRAICCFKLPGRGGSSALVFFMLIWQKLLE